MACGIGQLTFILLWIGHGQAFVKAGEPVGFILAFRSMIFGLYFASIEFWAGMEFDLALRVSPRVSSMSFIFQYEKPLRSNVPADPSLLTDLYSSTSSQEFFDSDMDFNEVIIKARSPSPEI